MPTHIVITGASGLLGRAVFREFDQDEAWEAVGLSFTRTHGSLRKVDLLDRSQVKQLVQEVKPRIIIHSAAQRRPDIVEKNEEATHALNVEATKAVCQEAALVGATVVFISTDYVFDGKDPPYGVDMPTNPINKYGISKLDGERVTLGESKDNVVLRVPVLYGPVEDLDESAVTCLFAKVMQTEKDCVMSDYEVRFPTHVGDVAKVLRDLCTRRLKDPTLTGVFHWSSLHRSTKYKQAVTMAKVFGLPSSHIHGDKNPSAGTLRPHDTQLDASRIEALGICYRRSYEEAIKEVLEPFFKPVAK